MGELAQCYNTTKRLAVFISFLILYMLKLHLQYIFAP